MKLPNSGRKRRSRDTKFAGFGPMSGPNAKKSPDLVTPGLDNGMGFNPREREEDLLQIFLPKKISRSRSVSAAKLFIIILPQLVNSGKRDPIGRLFGALGDISNRLAAQCCLKDGPKAPFLSSIPIFTKKLVRKVILDLRHLLWPPHEPLPLYFGLLFMQTTLVTQSS